MRKNATHAVGTSADVRSVLKRLFARREASLVFLLLVFLVPIVIRSPKFLSLDNINRLANDMSILAIVAIGEFFVILSNGIDLSLGSIVAFTGMSCGMINESFPELRLFSSSLSEPPSGQPWVR